MSNALVAICFQNKTPPYMSSVKKLLFQETNGIVAMLLLTFLHFIIYYVILTNHIDFQMLKLETLISIDFQSLILLNS